MDILADILMTLHFLWVLFMVLGLPLGLWLGSPLLRWVHFSGMALTALFAASGMYCPLTVWEEALRWRSDPGFSYGGSFLARHLSPLLYPQIDPTVIRAASVAWGLLTLLSMLLIRPGSPRLRDRTGPPPSGPPPGSSEAGPGRPRR